MFLLVEFLCRSLNTERSSGNGLFEFVCSVSNPNRLPDGYTVQNGLEQYNGFPPDLTRFLRSLGFCAVADPYHFEQVQVAKGRIRILPPPEAQLIKSKQRRYKLQPDQRPSQNCVKIAAQ